ncbi:type II toxin-antitoxin system HicB family antitoxin [candidate division KSB1 bacterium]|nr:type II toxin-antitoxin system HicB family antitoxin [candidate division KSB1 bacterium]
MRKKFIKLFVVFQKEEDSGRWTAECKELGTASFGNTIEEAIANIEEAICLHIEGLYEVGELERFFHENNINVYSKRMPLVNVEAPTTPFTFIQPQYYPLQHARTC